MISERLKMLRKQTGLTQIEFARQFNVANSTVAMWETDRREPDLDTIGKLSDFFNVSSDYLLGLEDRPQTDKAVRIPVLGSVPAGIPLEAVENILDWEEIPASMCSGGKEYFALEVKGDSMWPDYLEGDVVIVRKSPKCDTGDICVVYINGYDATLKQVKLGEDGSFTIIPRNQSYPPRTFSREEVLSLPVSIAGVVEELRRKIK